MPARNSPRRPARSRTAASPTGKIVVFVTCESKQQAETIARAVIKVRLAACANILPMPVQSIYRWQGQIESSKEFLMILKTSGAQFAALEKEIQRLHSYDVPEIIALPIVLGAHAYLSWIADSLTAPLGTSTSSGTKS